MRPEHALDVPCGPHHVEAGVWARVQGSPPRALLWREPLYSHHLHRMDPHKPRTYMIPNYHGIPARCLSVKHMNTLPTLSTKMLDDLNDNNGRTYPLKFLLERFTIDGVILTRSAFKYTLYQETFFKFILCIPLFPQT